MRKKFKLSILTHLSKISAVIIILSILPIFIFLALQIQELRNHAATTASPIKTVFVILMENNNWSNIKGNSSAPYINNTILPMSSYTTQYYNPPGVHPSEPNYLWLEAGTDFGISNDNSPSSNHQSTTNHLVTLMNSGGITWRSYQENISGTTCPLTDSYPYVAKHDPFVFFDDVTNNLNSNSSYCIAHERPYTQFATDLQNSTTAQYNFITPNLCNDMHDSCSPTNDSIKQGDIWLSTEVPKIMNSAAYKNGGAIFITWDEGEGGDGPIGMIVLSQYAKGNGYNNNIHYTHSSTLRTIEEIYGITPLLGDAANAADLSDLFLPGTITSSSMSTPTPSPKPSPTITPISGSTPTPTAASGANTITRKLTWSPPTLNNPITINLTTTHQNLNLDNTRDYILKFPSSPIVGVFNEYDVLFISGGHNIVMIGGEINVPDLPDTQNGITGNNNQRQAMRFNGQTGTVYIEGLEVSGTCMDFIDITAPLAKIIFQNVRIEQCRSHDEVNYSDEHPDLIQPWGGAEEIDIDGFTGFTDYQGFQLDSDLGIVGNIIIKHANIGRIASLPQLGRYYMWQGCKATGCTDNNWDLTDDSFYIQPGANSPGKSVWPDVNAASPKTAVLAADRQSISWPNYTNIKGRVHIGSPATGDFVPAGSVGIGYVTPGSGGLIQPINTSTPVPSQGNSVSPTINVGDTLFALTLCPHSIGNCGDSINPTGGNINPVRTQRSVTVNVYDNSGNLVKSQQGAVSYLPSAGSFQGTVDMGLLAGGSYIVKVKMDSLLQKQVVGIQNVISGQTNQIPATSLITGDIFNDNQLDIQDYNVLIGCYSDLLPAKSCTAAQKISADLNDDGNVNAFDYNEFLRELSVQPGN